MTILTTICTFEVMIDAFIHVEDGDDSDGNDKERTLQRLWEAIMSEKIIFVFGSFTLLCAWSLTSLLCFHGMIISIGQTTNERVRGVYRSGQLKNKANKGCCLNWYNAACAPCPVSRLPRDMSSEVIVTETQLRPEGTWDGCGGGGGGLDDWNMEDQNNNGGGNSTTCSDDIASIDKDSGVVDDKNDDKTSTNNIGQDTDNNDT